MNDFNCNTQSEKLNSLPSSLTTEKTTEFYSPIMTPYEVAAFTKFSIKKIYRLCKAGEIPHTKKGGQYRFHKDQIERWLKGELNE
jgi:excisionase family DNA binding protein